MLLAHTIEENRFDYKLKSIAKEYFGEKAVEEQEDLFESIKANGGTAKQYFKADSNVMAKYGIKDNQLTFALWKIMDPQLDKDGLRDFFYKTEVMSLYKNVTINLEDVGIPVDVPLLQKTMSEITQDIEQLEKEIQEEINPLLDLFQDWYIAKKYPFKLTGRFKQMLATQFATPNWPKTKTGTFSFSKTDLDRAEKRGLIEANSQLRKWAEDESSAERIPVDVIRKTQLLLLAEDGVKYPFNISSKDHLKR
jgi:hypothetical protein